MPSITRSAYFNIGGPADLPLQDGERACGTPPVERRSGAPHPVYDEIEEPRASLGRGLLRATITALVFWAVIALMIVFVLLPA